jgi:hypothetical protein
MKSIVYLFIIGAALAVASVPAGAQVHLGVKGGLNISSISLNKEIVEPHNVTGFHIGPLLEVMSPLGIGFDGAILYSQKGLDVEGAEEAIRNDYLEIPINLKVKIGVPLVKAYFLAGPYAEFRLSGAENKWDNLQAQVKTQSFGAGLNLGAGVEIFSRLQAGINYGLGLTDNYNIDKINNITDINVKRKTLSITATLLF